MNRGGGVGVEICTRVSCSVAKGVRSSWSLGLCTML